MKFTINYLVITYVFLSSAVCIGQTKFTQQKAGNIFYMSLPDYMTRTSGLNDVATLQYKNSVKDVYTIVIEDSKEELNIVDIYYSSINEFQEDFSNDFLKDEEKKTFSKPKFQSKDDTNFAEFDASYYDKDTNIEIYYLIGIVETKTHFYKVLSWTKKENKEKFKADFQKTLYSFKE